MIAKKIIEEIKYDNKMDLCFETLIDLVNYKAKNKGSFLTTKFGDNWKDHASLAGFYNYSDLCDMAWEQGRRAILLEDFLQEYCLMFDQLQKESDTKLAEYASTILSLRGEVLMLTKMLDNVQSFFDNVAESAKDEIINEKKINQ